MNMKNRFKGVIPPMLTAFTKEGELDVRATKNIARFLKEKVHGLFICGTYGSGPLMSPDEKKRVIDAVTEEVGDSLPVIVMAGSTNLRDTIEVAKYAEKAGTSAVASVGPYYYSYSEDQVVDFFSKLVQSVSIPVYVYNNPKTVGYPITPSLLKRLYNVGVKGIKDSSFSSITFYEFIKTLGEEDFDFIIGTEALVLSAYAYGARGVISGVANALPEPICDLLDACEKGDFAKASELQLLALKLRDLLHISSAISVAQAILQLRGVEAGYPREPFKPLEREKLELVKQKLARSNLLR